MASPSTAEFSLPPRESFYSLGGTLDWDAASYIERGADVALFDALRQGEVCYVLETRQVGKSSLLVHTAARLQETGIEVALLDLTRQGRAATVETWYLGLLFQLADQLGALEEAERVWEERSALPPVQRWFETLRESVLTGRESPLVVFVDEIDAVRGLSFSVDEFFTAVRASMQGRRSHPEWRWLTFCFAGAATPAQLTSDVRATPFNIGLRVELTDFTEAEALPLARGFYGATPDVQTSLLRRVLHWTGGHPYLTQRLCAEVASRFATTDEEVDRLCRETFLERSSRETDNNLYFVRERLVQDESLDRTALLKLYREVRSDGTAVRYDATSELASALRLAGVVSVREGNLVVRNRIYAEQFDLPWIAEVLRSLPDTVRKQAYWRGFRRAGLLSAVLASTAAAAVWFALGERKAVQKAQQESRARTALAREIEGLRTERGRQLSAIETARKAGSAQRARFLAEKMRLQSDASRLNAEKRAQTKMLGEIETRRRIAEAQFRQARQSVTTAQEAASLALRERDTSRTLASNARKDALSAARLAEEGSRLRLSTLARTEGQEREALSLGIQTLDPLVRLGSEPEGESLQAFADVVNKGVVLRHRLRLPWNPLATAFSPQGRTLVVGGDGQDLQVFDIVTGNRLQTLQISTLGGLRKLNTLTFAPDGKELLTAGQDGRLRLWKVRPDGTLNPTPRIIVVESGELPSGRDVLPAMLFAAFSPDGKEIATSTRVPGEKRFCIEVRDREKGILRTRISPPNPSAPLKLGYPDSIWGVCWSANGRFLIATFNHSHDYRTDVTADVFERASGKLHTSLRGASGRAVCWLSADILLVGNTNGTVSEWRDIDPNGAGRFVPGATYANASRSGTFWGLDANPYRLIVGGDTRGQVNLWHLDDLRKSAMPLLTLGEGRRPINDVRLLAGRADREFTFAVARADKTVEIWHLPGHVYGTEGGAVGDAVFSNDGLQLAMGDETGMVRLRPVAASHPGVPIETTIQPEDYDADPNFRRQVTALALSPDGKKLASGTHRGDIRIWDATKSGHFYGHTRNLDAVLLARCAEMGGAVHSLTFSPDGRYLLGSSRSVVPYNAGTERIGLWDAKSGRFIRSWIAPDISGRRRPIGREGYAFAYNSLGIAKDGHTAVGACDDGAVYLFDLQREEMPEGMRPSDLLPAVVALGGALTPDGKHVAVAYSDGTLRLWNRASRSVVKTVDAHGGSANAVAISPDGKWLASAGSDNLGKIWSLPQLLQGKIEPYLTLRGHIGQISNIRFSPESARVLTSSADGTARIWPITAKEYLAEAKAILQYRPDRHFLPRGQNP